MFRITFRMRTCLCTNLNIPRSVGDVAAFNSTGHCQGQRRGGKPPTGSPPTAGQDKAAGNDLVSPNKGGMQQGSGNRPDFKTLDSNNHGYLTADDVKSHKWLSKNFSRCNLSHDGHLTQEEYSNCNK